MKQTHGTGAEPQLSAAASAGAVTKRVALGLSGVALLTSAVLGSACELIADFDRSKLTQSSEAGGSGSTGLAGSIQPSAGSDGLGTDMDGAAADAGDESASADDALDAGEADAGDELDAGDEDAGAELGADAGTP